ESVVNYDVVLWWANVDNNLPKVRDVKEINPKVMLVSSKNNVDNKYSFQELIQKSLGLKSNLTIEFTKENNLFKMMIFDPLGNVWYEGTVIEDCVNALLNRLNVIKSITRESATLSKENIDLNEFYNMLKIANKNMEIKEKIEFLKLVREYANIFSSATIETKDIKRFLGNASFRCTKGFPSFRMGDFILVSRRNVDKENISIDEFVPVNLDNNKLYYLGDFKPSVDSPIQVRLYNNFTNINYMIHSHCYIEDAPYTTSALPCGALEEISEIIDAVKEYYDGNFDNNFYAINLIGHGSIMMANNPEQLKDLNIIGRKLPEKVYTNNIKR
ncbi:MAG: class II aldolase/adducin family protein, partial [Bacteroides graminisolvens]|nr:class II aldolase/adducin family protein [Bacteroides graminisolvens]